MAVHLLQISSLESEMDPSVNVDARFDRTYTYLILREPIRLLMPLGSEAGHGSLWGCGHSFRERKQDSGKSPEPAGGVLYELILHLNPAIGRSLPLLGIGGQAPCDQIVEVTRRNDPSDDLARTAFR